MASLNWLLGRAERRLEELNNGAWRSSKTLTEITGEPNRRMGGAVEP